MQQVQHKRFTMRNEQPSLPIGYCYAPELAGFSVTGKLGNNDRIRPWFKRQEA